MRAAHVVLVATLGSVGLLAGGLGITAAVAAPAAAASVSHVQGTVERGRGDKWAPLAVGAALAEGESIRTGKGSRVEVVFVDGSKFRVGSASEVVIGKAAFAGKVRENVSVKLMVGRAWASVAKAGGAASSFHVETTNAVAGVRGTSFAVLASGDASALVRVYSGSVGVRPSGAGKSTERKQVPGPREIDRSQWEEIVATAMKQVRVSSSGALSPAEDFVDSGEELEWAQWNQARDAGK